MTHALTDFLVERTDYLGMSPADLARASGLSRQVCWNWMTDDREKLSRLPAPNTLDAFAKALRVPRYLVLGKAVEALGVGYTAGDFVSEVSAASDRELLDELERRLLGGGARAGSAAANQAGAGDLDNNPENVVTLRLEPTADDIVQRYLDLADGDAGEAGGLLSHDGPKGAQVPEGVWEAALAELGRLRDAERGPGEPGQQAARGSSQPPLVDEERRRQDEDAESGDDEPEGGA